MNVQAKLEKLHRDGGTLKWTRRDGTVVIYDVVPLGLLFEDGFASSMKPQEVMEGPPLDRQLRANS